MNISLENLAVAVISSIGMWGANGDYPIIRTDIEEDIERYVGDIENIGTKTIIRYQFGDVISMGMQRRLIDKRSNKDLIYFPYSREYYKLTLIELADLFELKKEDFLNLSDRFNRLKSVNESSWDDEYSIEYDECEFQDALDEYGDLVPDEWEID